jgi:hypothetical protein
VVAAAHATTPSKTRNVACRKRRGNVEAAIANQNRPLIPNVIAWPAWMIRCGRDSSQ